MDMLDEFKQRRDEVETEGKSWSQTREDFQSVVYESQHNIYARVLKNDYSDNLSVQVYILLHNRIILEEREYKTVNGAINRLNKIIDASRYDIDASIDYR